MNNVKHRPIRDQKTRNKPQPQAVGICFEALEPRLLLSGAWGAGGDGAAEPVASSAAESGNKDTNMALLTTEDPAGSNDGVVDLLADAPALPALGNGLPDAEAGQSALQPMEEEDIDAAVARELVLVNDDVADIDALVADFEARHGGAGVEVVILDAGRDGIEQIDAILADRWDLAAVHVIAHGTDGQIKLGGTRLNEASLEQHSSSVAAWGQSLKEGADILFYGCSTAADSAGRQLVDAIAGLTGADVAASTDLTGHAGLGGDWDLEYATGAVEAADRLSPDSQQEWAHLLAVISVDTVNDVNDGDTSSIAALIADPGADGFISLRESIIAANNTAGADEILLPAGTYTLSLGPAGDDAGAFGDLDVTSELTITGVDATTTIINANGIDRVFHLVNGSAGKLTLTDLTVTGGSVSGQGGGIFVDDNNSLLTASRVIVTGNTAEDGAGIFNDGTLNLADVTISNNGGGATEEGGGLHNKQNAILDRVTISGNQADIGGGIHNDNASGFLSLTNVTISGNTAFSTGGGLNTQTGVTITNSTFTLNSATNGGGIANTVGTVDLRNTIVANNTATGNPDVQGNFNSLGFNLIENTSGGTGFVVSDITGVGAQLGALADNGGFGPTHALLAASPAIDPAGLAGAPAVDQRGYSRDATSDIGAYEYNGTFNNPGTVAVDNTTPSQGDTLTATVSDADGASGAITYQWHRDGVPIAGATAAGYTIVQADVGATLTVQATYTDDLGTGETSISAGTASVANVNDLPVGLPAITGTTTEDQVLTANTVAIADADGLGPFSYQWLRNGTPIAGATASTYTLADADVGSLISVSVSYTDGQGTPESVASAQTAAITNVNDAGSVAIDDTTPSQGDTLTAAVNDADGASGAIAYQWYRDGAPITGATAAAYTTVQADVGTVLTVAASYTDDQGGNESPTSAGTAAVGAPGAPPQPAEPAPEPSTGNSGSSTEPVAAVPEDEPATEPEMPDEAEVAADPEGPVEESIPEAISGEAAAGVARKSGPLNRGLSAARDTFMIRSPDQNSQMPMAAAADKREEARPANHQAIRKNAADAGDGMVDRLVRGRNLVAAQVYLNMVKALDDVQEEAANESTVNQTVLGSAIAVSTGLSVGYVAWLVRGGMLLSSLLSSIPAWQILDPLPVLAGIRDGEDSEDDESLESILEDKSKDDSGEKGTADRDSKLKTRGGRP